MEIRIFENVNGEEHIDIYCHQSNSPEVTHLLHFLKENKRLPAKDGNDLVYINSLDIMYAEYIDRKVFIYTSESELITNQSLGSLEDNIPHLFRCSKNTLLNINYIKRLQSFGGGRILVTLVNGEQLVISRRYAAEFRKLLNESEV
ncbi:LytR/AlgR family response regulator transcription factor [Ohessyouella blattaphilus]|uniref:LytTR family transcriptional regulator DNA-binding domain-containing protein n=1 Tax=Ohessyouella blattaphilus TaxID=2949333 RepID=A0ABT1EJN5_9FIRM|nr:LytTR family DNA-binding domain-containing protein [Ohessyouella blattaphilus]MCP1110913.1 LytTR family transcriptional regulator DNA-binding domain-containing protein [Ohessyouella blattaphilus]MCR8564307.1 LytTR family transcriptional regulator DNA-binding domain-containing protein [Ohessyouella blattaphilus]